MDQPNTNDDLLEQIARDLEARRGGSPVSSKPPGVDRDVGTGAPAEPPAEPVQNLDAPPADGVQNLDPTPAAAAPPEPEPFEGFSTLPPDLQERINGLRTKTQAELAAERQRAEAAAAELAKTRNDYTSMYNRVAPMQRELDRMRNQRPATGAAPATKQLTMEDWLKRQSPERQAFFREYPADAEQQFDIARSVATEFMQELQRETHAQIAQIKTEGEIARLSAAHPDWARYGQDRDPATGRYVDRTPDATKYWGWVEKQPRSIQQMAESNSAADISEVLTTFKWEEANPEYRNTLAMPEFSAWQQAMPRNLTELVHSTNLNERLLVLSYFWRDYEEAQGAAASPEAARAQSIAARRDVQAARTTPTPRGAVAPVGNTTAAGVSEDAVVEGVYQQMQARRNRT